MAALTLFDQFGSDLGLGVHNFSTATFKVALTNTAPDQAANAVIGDITQIANGNGYTTGGNTLTGNSWVETGAGTGIWQFITADTTFTATGNMATFQYAVLYNSTAANGPLVGFLAYASPVSMTNTQQFIVDIGSAGWFQIPIT